MSELGEKFATARFGLKKEAENGLYGQPTSFTGAYDAIREAERRALQAQQDIQEGARYLQELEANPPKSTLAPGLLAAGAGAGLTYARRATPGAMARLFDPMTAQQFGESVRGALGAGGLPDVQVGKKSLPFVEALLGPKSGLSRRDVASVLSSGSKWYSIPGIGPWLKNRRLSQATRAMSPELRAAVSKVSPERWRSAAKSIGGKSLGRRMLGGGAAGIAAMFLPTLLRYAKNWLSPGGTAGADAREKLQNRIREFEAYKAFLSTAAQEHARATQEQRQPRVIRWNPFEAYRSGQPLTIPRPPAQ